jgi:hypothetical protein
MRTIGSLLFSPPPPPFPSPPTTPPALHHPVNLVDIHDRAYDKVGRRSYATSRCVSRVMDCTSSRTQTVYYHASSDTSSFINLQANPLFSMMLLVHHPNEHEEEKKRGRRLLKRKYFFPHFLLFLFSVPLPPFFSCLPHLLHLSPPPSTNKTKKKAMPSSSLLSNAHQVLAACANGGMVASSGNRYREMIWVRDLAIVAPAYIKAGFRADLRIAIRTLCAAQSTDTSATYHNGYETFCRYGQVPITVGGVKLARARKRYSFFPLHPTRYVLGCL